MKMRMDIDPDLLEQVKRFTGESTQATAVNQALREWIRLKKIEELRTMVEAQPFEFGQSAQELREINQQRSQNT